MKRSYWEEIAPAYSDEIFDVLHNDKKGLISSAIKKVAASNKTVMDIGCAIGKWFPLLAPAFKKVIAVDISAKNLAIAKQRYPQFKNIDYLRANMSSSNTVLPACHVGICINAILTPSLKERTYFFKNIATCIKRKGTLILTIPSLESYLLTSIIQQQFKVDTRLFPVTTNAKEALRKWNNIRQGNADIDNVPHKHYLKEELQLLLQQAGFNVEVIQKIEYGWQTEFIKAPVWLKNPNPWDWMVVAKKG